MYLVVQIIVQVFSSVIVLESVIILAAHGVAAVVGVVELRVVAVLDAACFFPTRVVDLESVVKLKYTF